MFICTRKQLGVGSSWLGECLLNWEIHTVGTIASLCYMGGWERDWETKTTLGEEIPIIFSKLPGIGWWSWNLISFSGSITVVLGGHVPCPDSSPYCSSGCSLNVTLSYSPFLITLPKVATCPSQSLLVTLPVFFQQIFIECLLCAWHCSRHGVDSSEQGRYTQEASR